MLTQNRGRRWFIAGCVALILAGLPHGLAILQSFNDPQSPEEAVYRDAAKAFSVVVGPIDANA
jgi:hypothetical protein